MSIRHGDWYIEQASLWLFTGIATKLLFTDTGFIGAKDLYLKKKKDIPKKCKAAVARLIHHTEDSFRRLSEACVLLVWLVAQKLPAGVCEGCTCFENAWAAPLLHLTLITSWLKRHLLCMLRATARTPVSERQPHRARRVERASPLGV